MMNRMGTIGCAGLAGVFLLAAATAATAQTTIYENTNILTDAAGAPYVPDTESPLMSDANGRCCVRKAYLEDATVSGGGTLGEISFSVFNAGDILGMPFSSCFGVLSANGTVEVYADTTGTGSPDDDLDGIPDLDKLIAVADFTTPDVPCSTDAADTLVMSVDFSDQGVTVADGDLLFVRVLIEHDLFRQVQAGPPMVGSTANGYYQCDPSVSPALSGFIRTGDPDANLYLKITTAGGTSCPCELTGDSTLDVFDLLAYLNLWFTQDIAADIDGALGVDVFDLLAYLDCWFSCG